MNNVSCCDEAIEKGILIRKGCANWVCPTCGKDQILKLIYLEQCGIKYRPGKGIL